MAGESGIEIELVQGCTAIVDPFGGYCFQTATSACVSGRL